MDSNRHNRISGSVRFNVLSSKERHNLEVQIANELNRLSVIENNLWIYRLAKMVRARAFLG